MLICFPLCYSQTLPDLCSFSSKPVCGHDPCSCTNSHLLQSLPPSPTDPVSCLPFTSVKHRGADNPPTLCSAGGQTWASHRLQALSPRIHVCFSNSQDKSVSFQKRAEVASCPILTSFQPGGKLSIISAPCIATCKKDKCYVSFHITVGHSGEN